MKPQFPTQVKLFLKEVSLIGFVLSATSYLCMRAIFHELPFSINEDGLLLIKIFSAGFGTAFVIGIILYALNYIFKIIHAYIFSLRVFKFRRFFISKKESGAFMPA